MRAFKSMTTLAVAATMLGTLAGCSLTQPMQVQQPQASAPSSVNQVISVTGYGAPKATYENLAQRRLMAMRASELDAYRKLAEQVSGIHISNGASVSDFIAGRDRIRTQLNSFIQGAAITSQEFQPDGLAVTTMSLKVNPYDLRAMLVRNRTAQSAGKALVPGTAFQDAQLHSPRY